GGDRQAYLSMWSRIPLKVSRKSAPLPIAIPRPCLVVVGGVQPDLLPGRDDGFLDRLLWAYPEPLLDRWTDLALDPAAVARLDARFAELRALDQPRDPPRAPPPPPPTPPPPPAPPH